MNALSLGGEYALLALGLAIVFSVMGLVNFAHGDMITFGGYAMFLCAAGLGIANPALLLPVGVLSVVLFALFSTSLPEPVRGAPPTTGMLTAFGVSILIQNVALIFVGTRAKAVPDTGLPGAERDHRFGPHPGGADTRNRGHRRRHRASGRLPAAHHHRHGDAGRKGREHSAADGRARTA